MGDIKIPEWIAPPKEIKIRCEKITELGDSKELMIFIKINGEDLTAFIPPTMDFVINMVEKTVKAILVAKFNDDYLVDLPVETLTSGPRIRIPKDYIREVVVDEAA
jgi:hypothetical protein